MIWNAALTHTFNKAEFILYLLAVPLNHVGNWFVLLLFFYYCFTGLQRVFFSLTNQITVIYNKINRIVHKKTAAHQPTLLFDFALNLNL